MYPFPSMPQPNAGNPTGHCPGRNGMPQAGGCPPPYQNTRRDDQAYTGKFLNMMRRHCKGGGGWNAEWGPWWSPSPWGLVVARKIYREGELRWDIIQTTWIDPRKRPR